VGGFPLCRAPPCTPEGPLFPLTTGSLPRTYKRASQSLRHGKAPSSVVHISRALMPGNETILPRGLFPLLFQLCVAQKSRYSPTSYLHLQGRRSALAFRYLLGSSRSEQFTGIPQPSRFEIRVFALKTFGGQDSTIQPELVQNRSDKTGNRASSFFMRSVRRRCSALTRPRGPATSADPVQSHCTKTRWERSQDFLLEDAPPRPDSIHEMRLTPCRSKFSTLASSLGRCTPTFL
jgi:hypothetical protein